MKRSFSWLIPAALLFTFSTLTPSGGNAQTKYKVVEVKHLTTADDVSAPAEYLNVSYDSLREELAKVGIFGTVVGDGGTISDADAADAVVLECKVIKLHNNSLEGGHVQIGVTLLSRGSRKPIRQFTTQEMATNGGSWGHKAKVTAHYLAEEIKRNLK